MSISLPPEIWTRIFLEACVDGGSMACTLSEVSKYFRDVILPFQLDNVALLGPNKMVIFAEILQRRQSIPFCRRVRHLFLSSPRAKKHPVIPRETYEKTLRFILSTTAPDLITLTNTLPQERIGIDSVLCSPFPKLQELTIHGHFLNPIDVGPGAQLQPSFPALTHLHILSSSENAHVYTSRATQLTHLRLSAMVRLSADLYNALSDALSANTNDSSVADNVTRQPVLPFKLSFSIKRILIQSDSALSRFGYAQANLWRGQLVTALESHDREGKLEVLPAPVRSGRPGVLHIGNERNEWQDRIVGGHGCWSVRKSQINIAEM
jgi:hypothetical protein